MDDRRSVRSISRRKSPTPQPPSKATAQQLGRASRARSLRSASREVEGFVDIQKPARRSARQASVTTNDESGYEPQKARKTKRNSAKELLGDLTVVEEMDTQIDLEQDKEAPGTPTRTDTEPEHASFQSPGAASQMSGTTAISSFSMVEAEFLEPRFILKHLRKLCDSAEEFLEHIAPDGGTMADDLQNIREMQKPGSTYTEDYLDLNDELNVHLKHFKSEEHSYIHIRALHRALFKTSDDVAASQSGLNLILYLANLLVLAKQMIHSNRDDKNIWDVLRQLDNTFPAQFMQDLDYGFQPTETGQSGLYQETLDLAVELRTQLAILVLQRSAESPEFNVEETLDEIFLHPKSSDGVWAIRGWNMPVLGDDDSFLSQDFERLVKNRVQEIQEFFREGSSIAELDDLKSAFPWEPTILRLLDWVRLRRRELKAVIDSLGGSVEITRNVRQAVEDPQPVVEKDQRESLRKKRTSIGRDRRRSSRKFDPNAGVDLHALSKLKSREGDSGVYLEPTASRQNREKIPPQQPIEGVQPERNDQEDDSEWQTLIGSEDQQPEGEHSEKRLEEKHIDHQPAVEDEEEHQIEDFEEPQPSAPPQSPASLLRALKALQKPQKENRPISIFDRQTTAQRIEFGDGFEDTQRTAGPSNTAKGKQTAEPSPRKRRRENSDDSDSDAFETKDRGDHAPVRRRAMPWAKRQRTEGPPAPTSSGAPPSHQPPPRSTQPHTRPLSEQEESVSEASSPSMTEEPELPPSSTWRDQRKLAQENRALESTQSRNSRNERKSREAWSNEEEEALIEYMRKYPSKYSRILQYDEQEGGGVLRNRNQVNLKDKARNLAINMIRSGAGLRSGFENIIHPGEKQGRALMAAGWVMHNDGSWEKVQ
ncbi:hypothetical protein CC77DRAFT_1078352 [Alternaria alternata]|uniref:Myb-like domain-containing protein n=1 Tax=Alternaria alternata TaxID=5599 RepID=A0A177DBG7_ALTAL|nr:hypothetical protein CC77DRAFT_1078352 [Alternaria alternata]OAG16239.1 hypothetical protein CC77DRAFT_1078352 [Alternaria alternata]